MRLTFLLPFFLLIAISLRAQVKKVILSGIVRDSVNQSGLAFANVMLETLDEHKFVMGTITDEDGSFKLTDVESGEYLLETSLIGYDPKRQPTVVGQLSEFLDLGTVLLAPNTHQLSEVTVTGKQETISSKMDRKVFQISDNLTQSGGSLLEAMKNLPGITLGEDGRVQLRGSDKVMVLVDGKQTALTGFDNQSGLDNIPASAIERIEIINNPSSKFDANGNAGIVNIIYKKEKQEGFNGKVGLSIGVGALWVKKENLPSIRPQYTFTPKINPSVSINYRKKNVNLFLQGDNLYTHTLNKNEFVNRIYDNGDVVRQQTKRNRNTNLATGKGGVDWYIDDNNTFTASALFSSENIIDRGDEPFFNGDLSERLRLWQFLEDELKTTITAFSGWQHKFKQPGRMLDIGLNYTFHREDEKYFFTNILPDFTGYDAFKLISDEHVADFTLDYIHPLKKGRIEGGVKMRRRSIPTNMQFIPGQHSPLDTSAGGWAKYKETIPAIYGNYVYEDRHFEIEAGLRVEYVRVQYEVNPDHPTYSSDGYDYMQPFPNLRVAYKFNEHDRLSFFYNRRVDRPAEVDIRIFPKYDDAEIIKVGNPGLRPQFTNSYEIGYKTGWNTGSVYSAAYHKNMDATITRIASTVPGSNLIYNLFQNAGRSYNTGLEMVFSQDAGKWATFNLNLNGYQNIINAFTVVNKYPVENVFTADRQEVFSGSVKLNAMFHLPKQIDLQMTSIYLAPDIVPQGKVYSRFSIDLGAKKTVKQGKGEIFLNATDIANTLQLKKRVEGLGFNYLSTDYYETQVVRVGYSYKF